MKIEIEDITGNPLRINWSCGVDCEGSYYRINPEMTIDKLITKISRDVAESFDRYEKMQPRRI